jgi:hypothetical protein
VIAWSQLDPVAGRLEGHVATVASGDDVAELHAKRVNAIERSNAWWKRMSQP